MTAAAALLTAPWRVYPAGLLLALGLVVAVRGIRRERHGLARPVTDPGKGAALLRAGRAVLAGLAIAGTAAGWLWSNGALLVVSLLIGAEEMMEGSAVIRAVDAGGRRASTPRA